MSNSNNNNNQFDAEFETIERAMNSMFQSAFSMMFKQFSESNIFESLDTAIPGGTTVFDSGNLESRHISEDDSYGGNDFKRLARKSRENRVPVNDSNDDHANTSLIFNLLFQPPPANMFKQPSNESTDNQGGWTYTSTSQRTVYNPDGSQETIITKKQNGVTETIKQIRYPDGRTEQVREEKFSLWNRLFGK